MSRRQIVPLGLTVVALVALVGIAARGRPLSASGGKGGGLPPEFADYAFTTLVILAVLAFLVFAPLLFLQTDPGQRKPFHVRTIRSIVILIVIGALTALIVRHVDLARLLHIHRSAPPPAHPGGSPPAHAHKLPATSRPVQFRWVELPIALGVIAVIVAAAYFARPRRDSSRLRPGPEALSAALDESLDDLRNDPDLRRAIVAAYARMEVALAAAGLPRDPAEAPLEYLERALLELDASTGAVRRLTELFEWARFSHHEPEPRMRDEAIDALVAVRDELRGGAPVPA